MAFKKILDETAVGKTTVASFACDWCLATALVSSAFWDIHRPFLHDVTYIRDVTAANSWGIC